MHIITMCNDLFPLGNVSSILGSFHQAVVFGIPIGNDIKLILVVIDTIFMRCSTGSKVFEFSIWIISPQYMVIAYQCAAVIDNNIFTGFGSGNAYIIGFIIFRINQFIITKIRTHFMAVNFF